jgi:hypothetical protein
VAGRRKTDDQSSWLREERWPRCSSISAVASELPDRNPKPLAVPGWRSQAVRRKRKLGPGGGHVSGRRRFCAPGKRRDSCCSRPGRRHLGELAGGAGRCHPREEREPVFNDALVIGLAPSKREVHWSSKPTGDICCKGLRKEQVTQTLAFWRDGRVHRRSLRASERRFSE